MDIKRQLITGFVFLSSSLILSSVVFAEGTNESYEANTVDALEIIENSPYEVECIFGHEFVTLSEEEKAELTVPICDANEVSTEELENEVYQQENSNKEISEVDVCVPPMEYDSMTDTERAAIDAPLCDE